jgi:kynurenine formamidase
MEELDEKQIEALLDSVSNWGRWGIDDELGTLNFCGERQTLLALNCVRTGEAISCARSLSPRRDVENPSPLLHHMLSSGESAPAKGEGVAADWFGLAFHGFSVTHLDSLGHIFWNQLGYNGIPASSVSTVEGAVRGSIEVARQGIVTRGVLLDLPVALSVDWLEPGYAIRPDDLERAEEIQGVRVREGDLVFVRTGRDVRRKVAGPIDLMADGAAGLHSTCMQWLYDRSISVLGSDAVNDALPSEIANSSGPVHVVGLVAMGLWLLDNAYLETLSVRCSARRSWEFLVMLGPLALKRTTGSPINPIAVL